MNKIREEFFDRKLAVIVRSDSECRKLLYFLTRNNIDLERATEDVGAYYCYFYLDEDGDYLRIAKSEHVVKELGMWIVNANELYNEDEEWI